MAVELAVPARAVLLAGLFAALGAVEVELSWSPSADGDIVGYHVYRAAPAALRGEPQQRVATRVTGTSWRDRTVPNVAQLAYGVTAVDADGNESRLCAPASVSLSRDAFRRMESELYDAHDGTVVQRRGVGYAVAPVDAQDWLRLDRVDFADGAALLTVYLAATGAGADLALRLDTVDAPDLAQIAVADSGGDVVPVTVPVDTVAGEHDCYLVFTGSSREVAVDALRFCRHARRVGIDVRGAGPVDARLDGDAASDAAVPATFPGLDPALLHRMEFLPVPAASQ